MKNLVVFDLDGTLAESKSPLDAEMATLLCARLAIVKVAVISVGNWPQFKKQLLANLPHDDRLVNLSILPTCGTKYYQYHSGWEQLYSKDFTREQKETINVSRIGIARVLFNEVFPTGIDRRDDLGRPDRIDVYYGMADSRIGVARLNLPDHLLPGATADPPATAVNERDCCAQEAS